MAKPILLDGAFGTCLWAEAEKRGIEKTSTWRYNLEHPKLVEEIISSYEKAGSQIIYSNTFVATRPSFKQEHAEDKLEAVIKAGIRLVRESSNAKVAYSVGQLSGLMEPYGTITEKDAEDAYTEVIEIACSENPDYIVLETFMDLDMLYIAAKVAAKTRIPFICSMSFADSKKTILGISPKDMIDRLSELKPYAVGLNCSVGPSSACSIIDEFKDNTNIPLLVKPNSADLNAKDFAKALSPCLDKVMFAGSCCGSSPEYIMELKSLIY